MAAAFYLCYIFYMESSFNKSEKQNKKEEVNTLSVSYVCLQAIRRGIDSLSPEQREVYENAMGNLKNELEGGKGDEQKKQENEEEYTPEGFIPKSKQKIHNEDWKTRQERANEERRERNINKFNQ